MTTWHTPREVAERLRTTERKVQGLCASRQIAWRPADPESRSTRYLISDEAVEAYEKATTRPATVKPLRRVQS